MMKNILTISFILFNLFGWSQLEIAQKELLAEVVIKKAKADSKLVLAPLDMKTSLQKGFRTGNAKMVANYFSSNIDISVLNKENFYSKSQGEQVLKIFFMDHKPITFAFDHEGKSNNMKYYIGTLKTTTESFRVTVNIKTVSGTEQISHLTIEKND